MPKPKKQNKNSSDKIKIDNKNESGLAEFVKHNVPSKKELENFEKAAAEQVGDGFLNIETSSEGEEEIDESLQEIYQDDNGDMVDVHQLEIKRRHGFLFWIFTPLFILSILGAAAYVAYNYFYIQPGSDATAVDFKIEGKSKVTAGEEFFITIYYKNLSNVNLNQAQVEVSYPDNFIFLDSAPEAKEKNNLWNIGSVSARQSGTIKIKGKVIGSVGANDIVIAHLTYRPENFSSQFKKDASYTVSVNNIGIDFNFDYIKSVLVGEENILKIFYQAGENNYINSFHLAIDPMDNLEFISSSAKKDNKTASSAVSVRPGVWQINNIGDKEQELDIKFKFTNKPSASSTMVLHFTQAAEINKENKDYEFFQKSIDFEVMKSDLNLSLIVNGSREDQGVDFGQVMHYTVAYKNKGETTMKDVIIMAVLESDFINWNTFQNKNGGVVKGNTISWSKEELPALAEIKKNDEGMIDFSINVKKRGEISPGAEYQIKSYAQYNIGNKEEIKSDLDMRSNTIINKINSDLKLKEAVRYFNEDNIPVGTGPQPPKVGEKTSYKVYWEIDNSLHELKQTKAIVVLPKYVKWGNKTQTSVGNLYYASSTRTVIWAIGRLPITAYKASAEFSISITPSESDKNKIMMLLPPAEVSAVDSDTLANLNKKTGAKTTKLEDDPVAPGDGIVK